MTDLITRRDEWLRVVTELEKVREPTVKQLLLLEQARLIVENFTSEIVRETREHQCR
jgi:hypothetical protein